MNQTELEALRDSGAVPRIAGFTFAMRDNRLIVNDKVPLRIYAFDSSLSDGADLDILDDRGNTTGALCFCRRLGGVDFPALTEWQFAAFLAEVPVGAHNQRYRFTFDYAVIELRYFQEYREQFYHSAPIWGGFSHEPPPNAVKRSLSALRCQRGICFPTDHHGEQALRAVIAGHPFDRFLKLYHQLELLFDWVLVRRIQGMGTNLKDIAQIMSRYSSGDLPSLKELLREYCNQPSNLWLALKVPPAELAAATEVFQRYGKAGNPLSEAWDRFHAALARGSYDLAHARAEKLADNPDRLNEVLVTTAAYWLFRVRCCIAHNRIGEFILGDAEQGFVVNFAEPLLKEVLLQVLSHPDLPK